MNPLLVSMLPSCPLCGEGWKIAGARIEPKCNHWPEVNRRLARSLAARFALDWMQDPEPDGNYGYEVMNNLRAAIRAAVGGDE